MERIQLRNILCKGGPASEMVTLSIVKRGEIYYADLSPVVGSEQGGMRPVLIVQNDTGNKHSPTVIAAAITPQRGAHPGQRDFAGADPHH